MFLGFSRETLLFLDGLKENNNKPWFEARRDQYQQYIITPLRELALSLGPFMSSIDPLFEIDPKKAISRINRDVRFSRDKSPYRANMWIAFKRVYQDWKQEPTYFFELFPDYYRFGMGFYSIPRDTLAKLRGMIDERNGEFMRVNALYQAQDVFTLEGEEYKRRLNPGLPADLLEWYQKKELYFVCNRKDVNRLFTPELVDELIDGFGRLAPVYNFFLGLR